MRRGVRWLGVVAVALALAAATALAAPPEGDFTVTPDPPNPGEPVLFKCEPCPSSTAVAWDFDGDPGFEQRGRSKMTTFETAGPHTVRMRLTRDGEVTIVSKTVTVNAAAPTVAFDFAPAVPGVGETVTFTSTSQPSRGTIVDLDWDLDGDGEFDDFSGPTATWVFDSPGTRDVRLRARQSNGESAVGVASLRVNGLPSADFTWSPLSPVAGDSVDLVSTSTDFEGPLAAVSWDLDGDGNFGDGGNQQVRQPFTQPGTYDVGLQVTDSDGEMSTVRKQLVVAAPPPAPPGGGSSERSAARRPRLMSPFPVVRIAGTVLPRGAHISVLSVRAPRGSRIRVRCLGSGCPVGSVAITSTRRLVRFRKFERTLRAGIRLKLFVRQENRIGKYTRFLIRAGAPPKRVDMCLFPTRRAPRRCP